MVTAAYDPSNFEMSALKVMDLVGDKWTLLVTYRLGEQALRFADLKRAAEPISSKMLAQTLRELERFGMVHRVVLPTAPPGVEYSLTVLGRSFLAVASTICAWTRDNRDALQQARARFEDSDREQIGGFPGAG
jgi:DNA-binding HxlR family transcriptional regulator